MTDNQTTKPNSSGGSDADGDSDSGFFSDAEWAAQNAGAISYDVIHESEKGWCRVVSVLLRRRRVAVKCLRSDYAGNPLYSAMLEKEFEMISRLYHPSIVSYIAMEDLPGLGMSIIMEYIDGVPLGDWLKTCQKDRHEMLRILKELCEALGYLHSHGIIHRDLKPSNIMVTAAGRHIKLIDLGLAYSDDFAELSFPGGTRRYCAPEIIERGAKACVQTDIYSLGVIMREMLPNPGRRVRRIIERCLSTDAADRPLSAEEVIGELSGKRLTIHTWLAAATAALLIAVGSAVVAVLRSPRQESATEKVETASKPTATIDTTPAPAHDPTIAEIPAKPKREKTEMSGKPDDALIEEMVRYARQYTLAELEKHYGDGNDSLQRTSFPSWRVLSEIEGFVVKKCGNDTTACNRIKPIVMEASATTMREFHSRISYRFKKPEQN